MARLHGELGEGEHGAGIGRQIVLGDEFDFFAEHAARLVDPIEERDLKPASAYLPPLRLGR